MHPVAPRTGADEITIAENQLEYRPLVGAVYQDSSGARVVLTRWRLNGEDKRKAASGEDLTIAARVFDGPFPPLMVGFDLPDWMCPADHAAPDA